MSRLFRTTLSGLCAVALLASAAPARAGRAEDACIEASNKATTSFRATKLVESRASLAACAAATCSDAVRTSCQQRLADVNKAIPSVIFYAKDGAGNDLAGVTLSIDGAPPAPLRSVAMELDPGEHQLRFETAGQTAVTKLIVLHQGERDRREDVVIGPAAPAAPPPAVVEPPPSAPPPAPAAAEAPRGGGQRTAGFVIGGVGVAGLLTGGIFGAMSIASHGSYESNCGSSIGAPAGRCNATGVSGESDAATKGTVSTVAFVAGGVATVAGVVLYLTAPKGKAPQVGVTPTGLVVSGRF